MKSNWDGFFSSVFLGRWFLFFSPGKSRDPPLAASAGQCRAWHWRAKAGWGAAISHLDYVLHPKWDFAPLRAARAVVIASLISSLPHAHCWSGTGAVSAPAELPWWLSKQSPHSASIMGWKLSACCWYPASLGWGCSAGNDAFRYALRVFLGGPGNSPLLPPSNCWPQLAGKSAVSSRCGVCPWAQAQRSSLSATWGRTNSTKCFNWVCCGRVQAGDIAPPKEVPRLGCRRRHTHRSVSGGVLKWPKEGMGTWLSIGAPSGTAGRPRSVLGSQRCCSRCCPTQFRGVTARLSVHLSVHP